jgi:hypothetical protein
MRRVSLFLRLLLVMMLGMVAVVLASPGAASSAGLHGEGRTAIDSSTYAAINAYLNSIGVDAGGATFQRGARNYAGPNCPGKRWNCTEATGPVVQISSHNGNDDDNGRNLFRCTRSPGGAANPETNTCVIVQMNTTGTNRAVCIEHNEQSEGTVEQSCTITQTNVSGTNVAIVEQSVVMDHEDTTQRSEQRSEITQTNGTGSNRAEVVQRASLSTEAEDESVATFQEQDAIQDSAIDQETGVGVLPGAKAGNNRAGVLQSHRLDAEVEEAASAEQLQNTDLPFGETSCLYTPNICAYFEQGSTNGELLITMLQLLRHNAEAEEVEGDVFQQQGSSQFTGGTVGIFHQDSAGLARRVTAQDERQSVDADDTGPVTQIQFTGQGPKKNSNQIFNPDNFLFGQQNVVQMASDPTFQQATLHAEAGPISGEGRFRQSVRQNDASEQQTVTGGPGFILARIDCAQGEPPGDEEFTTLQEEDPCVATSDVGGGEGGPVD